MANAIAGLLALFSGIIFHVGMQVLKQEIAAKGGLFFGTLAASIIDTGIGPTLAIIAGIIFIAAAIIKLPTGISASKQLPTEHTTNKE